MRPYRTNIFCIISNIGSRQELYLNSILDNKVFASRMNLTRLVYNTTKKKDSSKEDTHVKFNYYTEDQFNEIPPEDIIEYRSYYTLTDNDIYYFTLKKDIVDNRNIICIASSYQYENYKRWTSIENMKHPESYSIYAILIHCSLESRFKNKLNTLKSNNREMELLEFSRRVLQDNAEFLDSKTRLPELKDTMNCDNTCYIDDDIEDEEQFKGNVIQIRKFIHDKIVHS